MDNILEVSGLNKRYGDFALKEKNTSIQRQLPCFVHCPIPEK